MLSAARTWQRSRHITSSLRYYKFPSLTILSSFDHFLLSLSPFVVSCCLDSHFPPVILTLSLPCRFSGLPIVFAARSRVLPHLMFSTTIVSTYPTVLTRLDPHISKAGNPSQNIITTAPGPLLLDCTSEPAFCNALVVVAAGRHPSPQSMWCDNRGNWYNDTSGLH